MEQVRQLSDFFDAIVDDFRIAPIHICVYAALLHLYSSMKSTNPMYVFSHEVMHHAKISSRGTYSKVLHALHDYGYIEIRSTRKNNIGTKVFMVSLMDRSETPRNNHAQKINGR